MTFFRTDAALRQALDDVLETLWAEFPTLAQNRIAITWIVYSDPVIVNTGGALSPVEFWQHPPYGAAYRGVECVDPASLVSLFYGVAIQEWLERNMVQSSAELERAIRDMVVNSSPDATSLVVDILSGTTSGPELPPGPFETWKQQRNIVNRYYQSLQWPELSTINVNQKIWCDGPYGRERIFLGDLMEQRNLLTTNATARLLHSIVGGVAVSSARSQTMMALLQQRPDPNAPATDSAYPVKGFLGESLPPTAQIWSKAGWTDRVRHEAAYIEIPARSPYLLVVFSEGKSQSQNEAILPFISQRIVEKLAELQLNS